MTDHQILLDRPELIMGPNPLIEALPPYLPPSAIARAFAHYPLKDKPWQVLPPGHREPLLDLVHEHVAPTALHLPLAISIQSMIRSSMCQRNPLAVHERIRCNRLGMAQSRTDITKTPQLNAAGGTVEGLTGMGKTLTVRRALELFAPQQVIDHAASPACGWLRLRQVTWIYIDHPSNGTRGALLKRILMGLDNAAGTNFSDQYARTTNIDALLVQVAKQLSLHRTALLIIDEKQQKNFQDSPWSVEFLLFYLGLMNLGISVLLVGNPLAFSFLRHFSQVVRRFSVGGMHRLEPASGPQEPWWQDDLVPRVRRFSLVEHVAIEKEVRSAFEFEHTAGIPGLLLRLQVEAERSALRRATGETAQLILADYQEGLRSPGYLHMASISSEVRQRDQIRPSMQDIPDSDSSVSLGPLQIPSTPTIDTLKRMATTHQRKQSTQLKRFKDQLDSLEQLSPAEHELLGIRGGLLAELDAMREDLGTPKDGMKSRQKTPRLSK